jgi:hypothetical protein
MEFQLTKKIYYEKHGRRYVPVAEYDSDLLDSFPKGDHLVSVYPGGQSRRFNIDPNYAALIAAGRVAEEAVCDALHKAQELKPQRQPITERQRDLWKELARSFNRDDYPLIRPASRDAAEAAVKALMEEADKLMTNPAVRKAYEHFMLMCELTKEEKNAKS